MFERNINPCRVCGQELIWSSEMDGEINGICVRCGNGIYNFATVEEMIDAWNDVNPVKPKMTKGDRIRLMSDEELAPLMVCPKELKNVFLECKDMSCRSCILTWLQEEVEE